MMTTTTRTARDEAMAREWATAALRSRMRWLLDVFGQDALTVLPGDDPYVSRLREAGEPVNDETAMLAGQWLREQDVDWSQCMVPYIDPQLKVEKLRERVGPEKAELLEEQNHDEARYLAHMVWDWRMREAARTLAVDAARNCRSAAAGEPVQQVLDRLLPGRAVVKLRYAPVGPLAERRPWLALEDGIETLTMEWPDAFFTVLCAKDSVEVCACSPVEEAVSLRKYNTSENPWPQGALVDMLEITCGLQVVLKPLDYDGFAVVPD